MTISYAKFEQILRRRHMTKKQLAEIAAIHPTTVTRMVTGNGYVCVHTLYAICRALDCNVGDIMDFELDDD